MDTEIHIYQRTEGMSCFEGVNHNESFKFYYVGIRKGDNVLWITIPKDNPKDYSLTESVKHKWVQKLWL